MQGRPFGFRSLLNPDRWFAFGVECAFARRRAPPWRPQSRLSAGVSFSLLGFAAQQKPAGPMAVPCAASDDCRCRPLRHVTKHRPRHCCDAHSRTTPWIDGRAVPAPFSRTWGDDHWVRAAAVHSCSFRSQRPIWVLQVHNRQERAGPYGRSVPSKSALDKNTTSHGTRIVVPGRSAAQAFFGPISPGNHQTGVSQLSADALLLFRMPMTI